VLEIGCGNGAATRLIMQHVRPARLVGIDISPVFVKMASEAFADEPGVSFALGDAAARLVLRPGDRAYGLLASCRPKGSPG
jgi:ubiquinone/menaquinone biosynthesis C-methylase UbiE